MFFVFLIIGGCQKDDGYRTVMLELEIDAIPSSGTDYKYLFCYFKLAEVQSGDEILWLSGRVEQGEQKITLVSDQTVLPVGYDVLRAIGVDSNNDDGLPCDATFRVLSDNKVIYSYTAKKGDLLFDGPYDFLTIK
jgi:hypothetical protein